MALSTNKSRSLAPKLISFFIVFCILASLAIIRTGSFFGVGISGFNQTSGAESSPGDSILSYSETQEIVNTTDLCKDVTGYAGPTPLKIYVSEGMIDSVIALPNTETPKFFERLETKGLTKSWNGKTLEEAISLDVDAVSGATYSSNAYIANVRAGAAYALGNGISAAPEPEPISAVSIIAFVVILAGATVPLFVRKPAYRLIQQLCNVAILGFWAGTFVDYAMMLNFFSSAPHFTISFIITLLLLITGLVYPLFNRPNYYCTWICPFGSLQDLAGKVCKKKWHLSSRLVKGFNNFRKLLWIVLLSLLYIGYGAAWIDYEIFSGFIVESASWIVLLAGGVFVILSLFVNRPFCRFVCPTGSLLKIA